MTYRPNGVVSDDVVSDLLSDLLSDLRPANLRQQYVSLQGTALADGSVLAEWLLKSSIDSAVGGWWTETLNSTVPIVRASQQAAQEFLLLLLMLLLLMMIGIAAAAVSFILFTSRTVDRIVTPRSNRCAPWKFNGP
jgi:hypothetical protein